MINQTKISSTLLWRLLMVVSIFVLIIQVADWRSFVDAPVVTSVHKAQFSTLDSGSSSQLSIEKHRLSVERVKHIIEDNQTEQVGFFNASSASKFLTQRQETPELDYIFTQLPPDRLKAFDIHYRMFKPKVPWFVKQTVKHRFRLSCWKESSFQRVTQSKLPLIYS